MDNKQADLDASTQTDIIQNLCERLRASYVFPNTAEKICDRLEKHLEQGDYSDITEVRFFAYALTVHMQEVCQDQHLWVKWHPEPLPDQEGSNHQNQEWMDEQRLEAELDNFGIHKVERLPGNVGYIDLRLFHNAEWGGSTAVAAMNFLENTGSLIIDLRNCLGGDPDMIVLISSYLFGEEKVHLNSIYWRDEDITQQYWTLPYIPGKRFYDKPVYVLISKVTFSGGEEFAYNLKTRQRATLVGEKTGGGAHAGASYRLHTHFEVFIPVGRAVNPITNQNWEGSGVPPDISVSQEHALKAAYRLALKSIVESIGEPVSGAYSQLLKEAQTALENMETT
jgi:C-terminal processing protease CtpA/Prc